MAQAQTLEECQQAAERNYPLIQQYGLIDKTTELTVANIQKGWLPQVSFSAQATLQSDVTAFPDQMQQMYKAMGIDMKGLSKDQYRVGVDVQQMVYDGGVIKSKKEIAREQRNVQTAQNEVNMYNVRKRVNEMYFGLLLLDEQIKQNANLQNLLSALEFQFVVLNDDYFERIHNSIISLFRYVVIWKPFATRRLFCSPSLYSLPQAGGQDDRRQHRDRELSDA